MEGRPMVSYPTGSMNSLLDKLTKLKNRPKIIEGLLQVLEKFNKDFLDEVAGLEETDGQVKAWMKQVRRLIFDIEDWIDRKLATKMGELESEKFEDFKKQIEDACERCTRYELLKKAPTDPVPVDVVPSNVTIESRLIWEDKPSLVALDRPKNELIEHLKDKEHKKLKMVSVVGTRGHGKTTLAKEIYAELQGQFDCQAFVSVGRRTPVRSILEDILRQVKEEPETHPRDQSDSRYVRRAITELRECLDTKRYFIIIDGVWSTSAWKVINCALPNKNRGSRVLTTTCIIDVAKSCSIRPSDVVHQMEALSEDDSKRLFDGVAKRPVDNDILKICGGMPLAIIVAAGLLPRKSPEQAEPKTIGQYILSSLEQYYSMSPGMTKILHMSYANLSLPVRSCFLYLSVFPEDYTIKKDRLVRLWGAEGFIPRIDKESLWITGERYFNELISRRLIQPVFDYDDDQAVDCTVHGVVLDFIRSLSRENNFATTAAELSSGPFLCDTIRRFSLDCSNEDEADTLASSRVHLSSMRSLTVFGDVEGMLDLPSPSVSEDDEENVHSPPTVTVNLLSTFKLIRVLDLEDTKNLKDHHLEGIGGLVLLRYLGLGGTRITELPEEIGKLEQLETLDLSRTTSLFLRASIIFRKLVHLLLDINSREYRRLLQMEELEEVSNIIMSDSSRWVAELLSNLNRLRILGVTLVSSPGIETNLMPFLEEVVKSNLHSLSLRCPDESVGLLLDSWKKVTALPVTFEPRRFELTISGGLKGVPPNMASLVSLTHLHIAIDEIGEEGLGILGGLPNLVLLKLSSRDAESCIIKKGAFPCLKVLSFKSFEGGMRLLFQEGAMPQLRRLRLIFSASKSCNRYGYLDFGIEHLTCLTRVHATIWCIRWYPATVSDVEAAEAADAAEAHIRAQVSRNPNKPTLELSRV